MNDTIDTLKIKVEGEGQSAVKTLDELISTLERVKGTTASRSIGTLTSKLESLKTSINDIKTKNLSKLNAIFSTLSNANKINISPRLPERIRELGEAVDTLDGIDFSKLNEMASGLSALSRVGHVNLPRVNGGSNGDNTDGAGSDLDGTEDVASRVVIEDGLSRMDRFSSKLSEIKDKLKSVSSKASAVKGAIKEAFSNSILGKFASKLKETISSLGRIAMYRIMRSLIKQVTEAFSTGINDMYQYSKTFNGNFAQSMDTAASALLSFKNSIGAVVAPIINLLVPWLDKVVDKLIEINNTAAMVIAGLTGKSTYSKAVRVTTEYAEAANKASENTGKVTEKVEELKRSLAGLDEITIIGNNLSPVSSANGGNDSITDGVDYSSMFVETPVDMAKVNEIKEKFEKILEIAKWIAITIAAWKLATFISSIAEALTGIGLLKTQMLGITLMITGFALEFSGGYHIGYGDAELWDYIKLALGSALGIAGSLLTFGTGPAGWIIGITAAVVIAIASITVGLQARLADVVQQAFYDAGGTITISDLAGQFERLMNDIININQPIIDAGTTIDNTMEQQVRPAITTIREIGRGIELNAYTAEEKIPELVAAFEELKTGTKTILDEVYENIIRAVSGSLSTALIEAGEDVPTIVALLAEIKGETDTTFQSITKNFEDAKTAYDNGSLSAEDYAAKILELTEQMNSLVGATDPVKDSFSGVNGALDSIDWTSKNAKDLAFSKVEDSATAATQAVNDAHDEIQENLETMRGWSDNADYQLALDKLMIANDATQKQQLEDIKTYTAGFYEKIQTDMLAKMVDMTDTLAEDYEKLDPIQKFFAGSKETYIHDGLEQYKKTTIDPVMEKMDGLYDELGMTGAGYASEAATEIINGLYSYSAMARGYLRNKAPEDAVRDAYEKVGQALPEGLIEGIKKKSGEANTVVGDLATKILETTKDRNHFDQHSPSKATEEIMKNNLLGFINGINNNKGRVMSSLDSFLNTMLSRFETFTNRWRGAINDMFDDMAYAWRSADFRSDGSYSYNRLSMGQIQRFAQGGFPEDGLFYANHNELVGQFTNGKTAVANNEQIVEGIAGGVAAANEQQNALLREQNRLLKMLLEKDSTIDVATITKAFNRKNQRDGKVTVPVAL